MIENPYISVEISEEALASIYAQVAKELTNWGIPFEQTARVHMSLAYVLGKHTEQELIPIINELIEAPFKLKAIGFNIIASEYFKSDLITFTLLKGDEFEYSIQRLEEENLTIQKNFHGNQFEAHITLFKIPQNLLSSEEKELFSRWLEMVSMDITPNVNLVGETMSVFNSNRELINSFKISR